MYRLINLFSYFYLLKTQKYQNDSENLKFYEKPGVIPKILVNIEKAFVGKIETLNESHLHSNYKIFSNEERIFIFSYQKNNADDIIAASLYQVTFFPTFLLEIKEFSKLLLYDIKRHWLTNEFLILQWRKQKSILIFNIFSRNFSEFQIEDDIKEILPLTEFFGKFAIWFVNLKVINSKIVNFFGFRDFRSSQII